LKEYCTFQDGFGVGARQRFNIEKTFSHSVSGLGGCLFFHALD
jgi:hypothetical protein